MKFCRMILVRKFILSILLFPAFAASSIGQSIYHPFSVPYLFSGMTDENCTNALNAAFNPSLIPYIKNFQAASYAEKKYLTDINLLLVSVCAPFSGNGVSFMYQRCGNPSFNENILGIGYGKQIGSVNAGILFQNIRVKIQDDKSVSLIRAGIATSIKINSNVFVGCRIINPNLFAKSSIAKLHAASSYSLIIGWEASSQVSAGLDLLKNEGRPLSLVFTMYYQFAETFGAALNWNTYSNQPYAALSWQKRHIIYEAGCSYHATLGVSPVISIIYEKRAEK